MRLVISLTFLVTFLTLKTPEVLLYQQISDNIFAAKFVKAAGSQSVNQRKLRKRKRVRRIIYRKPPMVYALPDKIEVFTQDEGGRELRRMEAVRWVRWF